ncbi:MAG: hypothetical protein ABSA46_16375 [Thermodesulfovibrionales bacterium]|jgi:hypothetical protein
MNTRILEEAEREGESKDFIESLKQTIREAQFKEKQWQKIASTGSELCGGGLSDEALQSWLDENILSYVKNKL